MPKTASSLPGRLPTSRLPSREPLNALRPRRWIPNYVLPNYLCGMGLGASNGCGRSEHPKMLNCLENTEDTLLSFEMDNSCYRLAKQ